MREDEKKKGGGQGHTIGKKGVCKGREKGEGKGDGGEEMRESVE